MPKIPHCAHCLFFSRDYHLICAIHPLGPLGDTCPDFEADPELEGKGFEDFLGLLENAEPDAEQWEPLGARYMGGQLVIERERSFYNGEEIVQQQQRWTREQQMELLDTHPLFTGVCPQCRYQFERDYIARVHWDCPECGWMDDSV